MPPSRDVPGVVVLGSDFKALGVIRSLGRRGIPCVVIDTLPRSAWFSRYATRRIRWHGTLDGEEFLRFLLNVCKRYHLEQWLLLPAQDDCVEFVARHVKELAGCFRLVTQDWDVLCWALDKRATYHMAQEVGVALPRTWYPTDERDLERLEIAFPAIIKPAASIRLQHATRLKALLAHTQAELLEQYRFAAQYIPHDEIMVQENIPGSGDTQYSVATYCKEGNVLLSMTARRIRQYPIDYGLSSSMVEAVEIPELFAPAARLLGHMRVTGMVEVEFKHDRRDDCYKLLDINVRPWGWHTLCMACGLDFPAIQYRDALGLEEPPTNLTPRYGYRWVRFLTDLPAGLQEIRAGLSTPRAYLGSLRGRKVFSVFDWRDPLPAVGDFAVALMRSLKGFVQKKGA